MLVFSTCLPLQESVTLQACMTLVLDWISMHPEFHFDHLEYDPSPSRKFKNKKERKYVFLRNLTTDQAEVSACRVIRRGKYAKWNSDYIYFRENGKPFILIQVFCNGKFPPDKSYRIKKPSIVKILLEKGYCRADYGIPITDAPLQMDETYYQACVDFIKKDAAQDLPAVLVSCDKFANSAVYYPYLAAQLGGMAYVFVQRAPETSKKLKADVSGRYVHDGSIGVYYPGEAELYKFELSAYADSQALSLEIINHIRCALVSKQENHPYCWENIVAMQDAQENAAQNSNAGECPPVCSPV